MTLKSMISLISRQDVGSHQARGEKSITIIALSRGREAGREGGREGGRQLEEKEGRMHRWIKKKRKKTRGPDGGRRLRAIVGAGMS